MACFLLVTRPPFPPLPERSVPFFSLCKALLTLLPAAFPYFAMTLSLNMFFSRPIRPGHGISYRYEEMVPVHFRRVDTVKHVVTRDSPQYAVQGHASINR